MINHKITKCKNKSNLFLISERIICDLINNNYYPYINKNYLSFKKNKKISSKYKLILLNNIYDNCTYFIYHQGNNLINLYFGKFTNEIITHLFKKYQFKNINTPQFQTILFYDNNTKNNVLKGGGFNPLKDPLYNLWFKNSIRASRLSLALMPIDDKLKSILKSFINLLNGNNPLAKIIEYSLSNDCLIRLFTILSNITINLMVLLSDSLVPIGGGIESISTILDGTGVGAVVGIFGNIIGLLSEFIPMLTNLLKQFFYFCNYMISILEFNKSLESLVSMAGGKKKSHKKKKKILRRLSLKKKKIIKQFGSGINSNERIIGVNNLLEYFFDITNSVPCFRLNQDFESELKSLDYTFSSPDFGNQTFQIRDAINSMFKYIEPVLQKFIKDPQNNNDLDKLCQISDSLIKNLISTIGKIVTLVTQGADNNIFGQSLELFISKSRPDKIYLIVKQLFKIIPESVVKILIDPTGMELMIDNFINSLITLINDYPEQIILSLQKKFACLKEELQDILNNYVYPFLEIINIFKDILIKNIENRLKPFLKSSILSLFLLTPSLIIFSYINCNCINRIENQDLQNDNNQDSENSNPFIKTQEQKKKEYYKISLSNKTIPIFMALTRETSLKFKN